MGLCRVRMVHSHLEGSEAWGFGVSFSTIDTCSTIDIVATISIPNQNGEECWDPTTRSTRNTPGHACTHIIYHTHTHIEHAHTLLMMHVEHAECLYIHMYACTYTHAYIYDRYVYIHIYTHTYTYASTYASTYT